MRKNRRVYSGKDIQNNFRLDWKTNISYKRAWSGKNVALEMLNGNQENYFAQLPCYCHKLKLANDGTVTHIQTNDDGTFDKYFIGFGVSIRSFIYYMRPLIKIDGGHLKGTYLGTNLLAVGMDANNQIIPLDTGVTQGETVENWSWFLTKLKECINDDFEKSVSDIRGVRPDAYRKLEEARFDRWSRAYFPGNKYNYMTSNSVESINSLTKHVRKVPIIMLMEYYRDLIQRWYFERRFNNEDEPLVDEPLDGRLQKYVKATERVQTGLFVKLSNSNRWAKDWFSRRTLKATYQQLMYPLPDVSMWVIPNDLHVVLPPALVKPQIGRPKDKDRIRSQGEEPKVNRCSM
ncbi:transposase, MuDR, MULE transposase domain protein [Tanacetum coccineum]